MSAVERRLIPRTKLEKLAYIDIAPNNGGIVLNVSGDGLAFHSMAPIERNGPMRFSLKEQNRRIDVCGELIWTDEAQKIGGLRFTTLTNEAREHIDNWAVQPQDAAPESNRSSLGAAFLRVFPNLHVRQFGPRFASTNRLAPLRTQVRLRMSGFSGGLATGLLISILTSFIFVFSYVHRQQFGESLIRLGQRLAAKSEAAPQAAPTRQADAPALSPAMNANITPVPKPIAVRAPVPELSHSKVHSIPQAAASTSAAPPKSSIEKASVTKAPQKPPKIAPAQQADFKAQPFSAKEQPAPAMVARANVTQHVSPPNSGEVASALTPPISSASFASPAASSSPNAANIPAPREPIGQVHAQSSASGPALPLQRFFDLGKFKQQEVAEDLSERVAQLGMHASVVNKGHLWMNSYQVLVGPYLTSDEEKKIHTELASNGLKARPFERGSRGLSFRSGLTVNGSKLPVGDFTISWETYVEEAKVKFAQAGAVVATADGKWVSHPQKFAHDEYVYQNAGGNSRPLLEVHFAGLDRALVFR
jgi:hypothetical protein